MPMAGGHVRETPFPCALEEDDAATRGITRTSRSSSKAETVMQEAHHLLSDVIDGSSSPIFLKDPEGRCVRRRRPVEEEDARHDEEKISKARPTMILQQRN